jgi:hypothetical protein
MAEPYFDSEGNQVFSGKGRRSKRVGELARENGLYHKIDGKLVHVLTDEWGYPLVDSSGKQASTADIQAEITQYLKDTRKNQERDNCRACKFWTIPTANWPNTKHGKCTKQDIDMRATEICKFFARPGNQSESEWWDGLSKKEKDKIIKSHNKMRKSFIAILDGLIEFGDRNSNVQALKDLKKDALKMKIGSVEQLSRAYGKRLDRFNRDKDIPADQRVKIQKALRKRNRKEQLELAASKWSEHGVKQGKDCLILGDVEKRAISGMATYLRSIGIDPKYGYKQGVGYVHG